jgi:hypothetical protein
MSSMINDLEKETMKKLVNVYRPQEAVDIYGKFVANYKKKHIGEILLSTNPKTSEEWYNKRAEVFHRFVSRYYLPSERK